MQVRVMLDADGPVTLTKHVHKIHGVDRIGRIRVERPLQVTEAAALAIMPAVMNSRPKPLTHEIGHEKHGTAGFAMNERRLYARGEILAGRGAPMVWI